MVLDPLTAIGLAGNIVQFVDFSCKIIDKSQDIHKAEDQSLPENTEAETVAKALLTLNSKSKTAFPPTVPGAKRSSKRCAMVTKMLRGSWWQPWRH